MLQADVLGQAADVQRRDLGQDQRTGVGEELAVHARVLRVNPVLRDGLFVVGDVVNVMQLGDALIRIVAQAL